MGKYIYESKTSVLNGLGLLRNKIVKNPKIMRLEDFEVQRNSLDLAKINIGNVNKKAVYNGVYNILIEQEDFIDWALYFKGGR